MSQEIVYTSAPKGLKPGATGFCTVMSTYGMATNLANRLEALTGYSHVKGFTPEENPPSYSHLLLTIGGRKIHVLSRIVDPGPDHRNRTGNKLAHLVAFDHDEIAVAQQGPAEMLDTGGFCITAWDGNLNGRLPSRRPAPGKAKPRRCDYWEQVTGDAGWAGVLAKSAGDDRGRPYSLIFRPGTNVLRLVVEAMSLLQPEDRWMVTFSTYFTQLPADISCTWRFLIEGSEQARSVRRNPHSRLIDLCQTLGRAPNDEAVEAARNGLFIRPMPLGRESGASVSGETIPESLASQSAAPMQRAETARFGDAARQPESFSEFPLQRPIPPGSRHVLRRGLHREQPRAESPHRWSTLGILLGLAAAFVVVLVFAGGILLGGRFFSGETTEAEGQLADATNLPSSAEDSANSQSQANSHSPQSSDQPLGRVEADKTEKGIASPGGGEVDAEEGIGDGKKTLQRETAIPAEGAESHNSAKDPDATVGSEIPDEPAVTNNSTNVFQDIDAQGRRLVLPPAANSTSGNPISLAKIRLTTNDSLNLQLLGAGEAFHNAVKFSLEEAVGNKESHRNEWTVRAEKRDVFRKLTTPTIASFSFNDGTLSFQWEQEGVTRSFRENADQLRYCVLKLEVGTQTVCCFLNPLTEVEPLSLTQEQITLRTFPSLRAEKNEWKRELLRMDLRVEGVSLQPSTNREGVGLNDNVEFTALAPNSHDKKLLDLVCRLIQPHEFCVQVEPLSHDGLATPLSGRALPKLEAINTRFAVSPEKLSNILKAVDARLKTKQDEHRDIEKSVNARESSIKELNTEIQTYEQRIDEATKNPLKTHNGIPISQFRNRWEVELKNKKQSALKHNDGLSAVRQKEELLRGEIAQLQDTKNRANTLKTVLDGLVNKARIHFRIYTTVAGKQVDLVRTMGFDETGKLVQGAQ